MRVVVRLGLFRRGGRWQLQTLASGMAGAAGENRYTIQNPGTSLSDSSNEKRSADNEIRSDTSRCIGALGMRAVRTERSFSTGLERLSAFESAVQPAFESTDG